MVTALLHSARFLMPLMLLATAVSAAGSSGPTGNPRLASLQIEVWPEFDRPAAALVILRGDCGFRCGWARRRGWQVRDLQRMLRIGRSDTGLPTCRRASRYPSAGVLDRRSGHSFSRRRRCVPPPPNTHWPRVAGLGRRRSDTLPGHAQKQVVRMVRRHGALTRSYRLNIRGSHGLVTSIDGRIRRRSRNGARPIIHAVRDRRSGSETAVPIRLRRIPTIRRRRGPLLGTIERRCSRAGRAHGTDEG